MTFEARSDERLDAAVAGQLDISRTVARDLVTQGYAQVNGVPVAKAAHRLHGGEIVSVMLPDLAPEPVRPEDIPIEVFFQDSDMLAINKPPGLTVHPTASLRSGTLVNALLGRYPLSRERKFSVTDDDFRPGIVHRLDKDTSGVMVVACNDEAHQKLAAAFKQRVTVKEYVAITDGVLPAETILDAPIGRHPVRRQQMTVGGLNPKQASSVIRLLGRAGDASLVQVRPHTGRTHQIRVHLQHLRTPVLGDAVYGRESDLIPRQALHAHQLIIPHPHDGQAMTFTAAVPDDMRQAWAALGGTWPEGLDS